VVGDRPAEKGIWCALIWRAARPAGCRRHWLDWLVGAVAQLAGYLVVLLVLLVKIDRVTEMWGKILWGHQRAAATSNHDACRTPGPRLGPTPGKPGRNDGKS